MPSTRESKSLLTQSPKMVVFQNFPDKPGREYNFVGIVISNSFFKNLSLTVGSYDPNLLSPKVHDTVPLPFLRLKHN